MTPQELVTAAQNGNPDAFAELWKLYRKDVYGFAYRRVRDPHIAEDITSETFLRAWRALASFTWQGKGFGGWVITIASHKIADHFASTHQRHSRPFDFTDSDAWQMPTRDRRTQPERAAEQIDVAEALDTALADLTGVQREAIALRFGADLRIAEAAEVLGRQQGAIKAAQHKATLALRRHPAIEALAVVA